MRRRAAPTRGPVAPSAAGLRALERRQIVLESVDKDGTSHPAILQGGTGKGGRARDYVRALRTVDAYSPLLVRTASPLPSPPPHPPLGLIPSVSEPARVEEEGNVGEAARRPPLHRVR